MSAGPLDGLIVVDLSRALAGPHATMMLADQGARVIKVEPPGGDDTRGWGPPFVGGHSTYFMACNRNKESITVDLKAPDGTRTLTRLLRHADVLVENFRTGVLDRLGFSDERIAQLNPRLIVLSITGFGHDGPEGGRAGYDQIAQGEAGLMSLTGPDADHPTRVGTPISDLAAGMYGAFGVLAALRERARTGHGTIVRTSLLAADVGLHAYHGTRYTVAGEVSRAGGDHHPSICPYGLFRAADGPVQISVGSDRLWHTFAARFGIDRPGWEHNAERVADRDAVIAAVGAAFAPFDRATLLAMLDDLGVPAGRVRDLEEVYTWEQTRSQGLLISVDHAALGSITLPGPPLRYELAGRPGARGRLRHRAPPLLGQHEHSVRVWLDERDAETDSADERRAATDATLTAFAQEFAAALGALGYTKWLHDLLDVGREPPTIRVRLHEHLPEPVLDIARRALRAGIGVEHAWLSCHPEQMEADLHRLGEALRAHQVRWTSLGPDWLYTRFTVGVPEASLTPDLVERVRSIAREVVADYRIDVVERPAAAGLRPA